MRNETALINEIDALRKLSVGQLKKKYLEVFGEETRSNHRQFLFRRVAWRIQANAEGRLSERARQRALEIANDADLRIRGPRNFLKNPLDTSRVREVAVGPEADPRLPLPGTDLIRRFRGKDVVVRVRRDGFDCEGRTYPSLSGAVYAATGTRWNGFTFFGLGERPGRQRGESE